HHLGELRRAEHCLGGVRRLRRDVGQQRQCGRRGGLSRRRQRTAAEPGSGIRRCDGVTRPQPRSAAGGRNETNGRLLMEKMPYRVDLDLQVVFPPPVDEIITTDWRAGLPVLSNKGVTLRELRITDAQSLFAMLTTEEVSRFISPPPTTIEGFE